MNTNELRCMLSKDKKTRQQLVDVFALDQFKNFVSAHSLLNGIYVINDQNSYRNGNHWFLVHVDENNVNFVDSFAKSPNYYNVEKELCTTNKSLKTIQWQIQSIFSDVCGGYVVYFSTQLCRNNILKSIVKKFSKFDLVKNDQMIKHFIVKHFPGHYTI